MATVFEARAVLAASDRWHEGGGLLVDRGQVVRVLGSRSAVRRAASRTSGPVADLGDVVVTPGLVNAHAHLELGDLRGAIPRGLPMVEWVGEVVRRAARREPADVAEAATSGARELLGTGATLVGDVSSSLLPDAVLARARLRRVQLRELLDAGDPERREAALATVARALPRRARRFEGLSPHGPHTASPELLAATAELARRRGVPVQTHWAESEEEVRWLAEGAGPFAAWFDASPRTTGLDLLDRAGLLGERTSLVHGNHPSRGDAARIARAGATVVHCPGSHAYFARGPFPLERYRRAGVALALGTDSLASNDRLDVRAEMAALRLGWPSLGPAEVFHMATAAGARALGLERRAGVLAEGSWADFAAFDVGPSGSKEDSTLEALTAGSPAVRGVWVGGRRLVT